MKVIDSKGTVLLHVIGATASGMTAKGMKDILYHVKSHGSDLVEEMTSADLEKKAHEFIKLGGKVVGLMPEPVFVEPDIAVEVEGRSFSAGGAMVTAELAMGYPSFPNGEYNGAMGEMKDGRGNVIGSCKITSRWKTPQSHISTHQFQIEAAINGVRYTGRGGGSGMLWRGKRVA